MLFDLRSVVVHVGLPTLSVIVFCTTPPRGGLSCFINASCDPFSSGWQLTPNVPFSPSVHLLSYYRLTFVSETQDGVFALCRRLRFPLLVVRRRPWQSERVAKCQILRPHPHWPPIYAHRIWRLRLLPVGWKLDKNTGCKCRNHASCTYVVHTDSGCEFAAELTRDLSKNLDKNCFAAEGWAA